MTKIIDCCRFHDALDQDDHASDCFWFTEEGADVIGGALTEEQGLEQLERRRAAEAADRARFERERELAGELDLEMLAQYRAVHA